jgi:hypothetical protein
MLWWNFYFPEDPILEPFIQDPNNGASEIQARGNISPAVLEFLYSRPLYSGAVCTGGALRILLEYKLVRHRIYLWLDFSTFQNSIVRSRLCRILIMKLLGYRLAGYSTSVGLQFLYSRKLYSQPMCTGSKQGGFWNIGLWDIQFLLGLAFYIPELYVPYCDTTGGEAI